MLNETQQALVRPLAALSARIGQDPLLTQAAGGNTSIKAGSVLWVKASGKWLAKVSEEPMFVPVNLDGVRRRIAAGEADPAKPETLEAGGVQGLRPSIETTLHALMPHPVVLHVHSVNTIAWAARADGESRIAERLAGLNWVWVPYCRPGLPLTQAVARVMETRNPDVLIIANHGPVLGAADCAAAEALLLVAGAGVLIRDGLPAGAEEMVQCLADVAARIPEDAPISYLSEAQNAELLDWDAEKYRRSMAAGR